MENVENDERDPPSANPVEEENGNNEKAPLKNPSVVIRKPLVYAVHYSDLRHFQRLVNEYQKNPEDIPR